MNGSIYRHDPSNGYCTGTGPICCNNHTSTFTPNSTNIHFRHSHVPVAHQTIHSPQLKQASTVNQRHVYMINLQQQQQLNLDPYNFENNGSSSTTAYYDRIHAQVRSTTPVSHTPHIHSPKSKSSRETTYTVTNGPIKGNLPVASGNKPTRSSPQRQVDT
jgi:hypothetical protein